MHHEDPGALVLFQYRVARVVLWQTYLLRLYIQYRSLPKFVGAVLPGLHPRSRPQGASNLPRTVRTDLHWKARHAITTHPQGDACVHCGRTTRAARQGRLQQWRRTCFPLQVHQRRLAHQHRLVWQGRWLCSRCPCAGRYLHKRGCHPLRGGPGHGPNRPQDPDQGDDHSEGGNGPKRPIPGGPPPPASFRHRLAPQLAPA